MLTTWKLLVQAFYTTITSLSTSCFSNNHILLTWLYRTRCGAFDITHLVHNLDWVCKRTQLWKGVNTTQPPVVPDERSRVFLHFLFLDLRSHHYPPPTHILISYAPLSLHMCKYRQLFLFSFYNSVNIIFCFLSKEQILVMLFFLSFSPLRSSVL